ncbi:MAG: type II toxin-antitoxin system RelE/ParE family toxin [Saprospiraceae bacterium]|nr:type II toxin-antitoxin system RelE/ParE family toxin [Saprospiraceae bacterium]
MYVFHLEKSERYADTLLDAIFDKVKPIEQFPLLGRMVPELNIPSIRELIVEKYRIIYFVSDAPEIRIIAIRHSARPLDLPFNS